MRNNIHLKFKKCKDRKKYSQKTVHGYLSKTQSSPPPKGAVQEKLVTDEDFEGKKLSKNKNKKKWKRKNKQKKRT